VPGRAARAASSGSPRSTAPRRCARPGAIVVAGGRATRVGGLDLVPVAVAPGEALDIDTWEDYERVR